MQQGERERYEGEEDGENKMKGRKAGEGRDEGGIKRKKSNRRKQRGMLTGRE